MKPHQKAVIDELRNEGYAVAVFAPDELEGVAARDLENVFVREGNEAIDLLGESAHE